MSHDPSPSLRWRWLHCVGYLCTLLITVEILWAGTFIGATWRHDRARRADYRARSRVHEGILLSDPAAIDSDNGAILRLAALAPLAALGPDSVRIGINPALLDNAYALAMRRHGAVADGMVVVFERRTDGTPDRRIFHFQAPATDFEHVMRQFDAVTDGYRGGDRLCTDGVEYAFERRRGALTTSGASRSSCDQIYERAANILTEFARRFVPPSKVLR